MIHRTGSSVRVPQTEEPIARGGILNPLIAIVIIGAVAFGMLPVWSFTPPHLAPVATPQLVGGEYTDPAYDLPVDRGIALTAPISSQYSGVGQIRDYVSADGSTPASASAPAAGAAVLAFWHRPAKPGFSNRVSQLQAEFGSDMEFGFLGTSPARMQEMLSANGLHVAWGQGDSALRQWVGAGYPVVVPLDLGSATHSIGFGWAVVYAYSSSSVYLLGGGGGAGTAPAGEAWASFDSSWTQGSWNRLTGMQGDFLVAAPYPLPLAAPVASQGTGSSIGP